MKKLLGIMTLMAVISFSQFAIADAAIKIAVVDFQQALNGVNEGKTAKQRLEGDFKKKQKQLDIQQKELEALKNELQQQAAVLPQDKLRQKQADFQKKFVELRQKAGQFQQEMVKQESELSAKILGKLKVIVGEIGRAEAYTLIVEKSNDPVLYVESKDDLTSRVIKEYNKRHK